MKVVDLKALLTDRKIRTSGKKNELIRRLSDSYKSNASLLGDNELQAPEGFPATSQWRRLVPKVDPITLPPSRFQNPTQMDVQTQVVKFSYAEQYDREEYTKKSGFLLLTVTMQSN